MSLLRVISLGAGVQSSAMLLMACRGELPKPDAAIFADTQWEPKATYTHLGWLATQAAIAGIPLIQATRGNLRSDALRSTVRGTHAEGSRGASMPLYVLNPDGSTGAIRRQCTKEYKLEVITKETRRLLGLKPKQRAPLGAAEMWIGISADEAGRMRDSRVKWQVNRYPLIYDFNPPMTRADCKTWLTSHGYSIPPKSACLGCPFHSNAEWHQIKSNPAEWADVVEFDKAIRYRGGMRGQLFLHRSCKPLDEIDFSTAEERGQMNWLEECFGLCGV